jgi:hypothetical protein
MSCGGGVSYQNNRMMVYEDNTSTHHHSYGMSIYVTAYNTGLGLFGSSGTNVPDYGAGGTLPHLFIQSTGNVAIGHVAPAATAKLHVVGNILASGSITGSSKSFDIPHPDPAKPDWRLRHFCTETDARGGNLLYRRQLTAPKAGLCHVMMPGWFPHLATNVMVFVSPVKHFGQAWGEQDSIDPSVIQVTVSKGGVYNVMITADRNDMCARECPQETEYIPAVELPGEAAFPP